MPDCQCRTTPQLVLARYNEDITWARNATGVRLIVYNSGEPLGLAADERRVPNAGREALSFVTHLLELQRTARECGATCTPRAVIFSQATPMCSKEHGRVSSTAWGMAMAQRCSQHVLRYARAVADGAALRPTGFVPLDYGGTMFQAVLKEVGDCWRTAMANLFGGPSALLDVIGLHDWVYYNPSAQFAVARANILATPSEWLERAAQEMRASRLLPWLKRRSLQALQKRRPKAASMAHQQQCCDASQRHTCLPWLLERTWALLLSGNGASSHAHRCPYPALLRERGSPSLAHLCSHAVHARASAASRLTDPMDALEYDSFLRHVRHGDAALQAAAAGVAVDDGAQALRRLPPVLRKSWSTEARLLGSAALCILLPAFRRVFFHARVVSLQREERLHGSSLRG